eukprot:764168-Hanusia_phi.AAC.4
MDLRRRGREELRERLEQEVGEGGAEVCTCEESESGGRGRRAGRLTISGCLARALGVVHVLTFRTKHLLLVSRFPPSSALLCSALLCSALLSPFLVPPLLSNLDGELVGDVTLTHGKHRLR